MKISIQIFQIEFLFNFFFDLNIWRRLDVNSNGVATRNVDRITFFIIRCHKSFTLLKLLKLMIFFARLLSQSSHPAFLQYSLSLFILHWFELNPQPANPMRSEKIKKSPEQKEQHNSLASFWQWLITAMEREWDGETRTCLPTFLFPFSFVSTASEETRQNEARRGWF